MGVTIHTARPGIVIGKKGEDVEKLRKVVADIAENSCTDQHRRVRKPNLDAKLVADSITSQPERRVMFRRAMKRAVQNAMRLGAKVLKLKSAAVWAARNRTYPMVPRGVAYRCTLCVLDIDYNTCEVHTTYGVIGVKVWIFKGEILRGMAAVEQPENRLLSLKSSSVKAVNKERRHVTTKAYKIP
ncbi:30S ribosomal protein S3 [Shigella flexneri]